MPNREKVGPLFSLSDVGKRRDKEGILQNLSTLDRAALATAPIPVIGDIVGGAADIQSIRKDPSLGNFIMAGAGLLPFVPSSSVLRSIKSTVRTEKTSEITDKIRRRMSERLNSRDLKKLDDSYAFGPGDRETARIIDRGATPVEGKITVFRGSDKENLMPQRASATTEKEVAEKFSIPVSDESKVFTEIEVMPGTKLASPDSGIPGEVVFHPDTDFEVMSTDVMRAKNGKIIEKFNIRAKPNK